MSSPPSHPHTTISPPHPVLLNTQSQWLFSKDDLARSPSVLDGMPIDVEHTNRSKGINFILQVGITLKLPQNTLFTASIYLHRFFMRYSMKSLPNRPALHFYDVAGTALFLATKVDENCRKFKDYIITCARVGSKDPKMIIDEQSKIFWNWRDAILHHENLLLEALCFDLQLELPHKFLWDFIVYFNMRDNKQLRNAAWAFLNDSMYTVLCLRFPARTIAAGALYAAATHLGLSFPDDPHGRAWWEQLDLTLHDLRDVCNSLADIYDVIAPQPSLKSRPEHIPAPANHNTQPQLSQQQQPPPKPSPITSHRIPQRIPHPLPPHPPVIVSPHDHSLSPRSAYNTSRRPSYGNSRPRYSPPPMSALSGGSRNISPVSSRVPYPPPPGSTTASRRPISPAPASTSVRGERDRERKETTMSPDETQQRIDSILYKNQHGREDRERDRDRDRDRDWSDRERDNRDRDRDRDYHSRRPYRPAPPPASGSDYDQRSTSGSRVPHSQHSQLRHRSREDEERYRDYRERERDRDRDWDRDRDVERERERERDRGKDFGRSTSMNQQQQQQQQSSSSSTAATTTQRRGSVSGATDSFSVQHGTSRRESLAVPVAETGDAPVPASAPAPAPAQKGSTSVSVPSFGVDLPIIPPPPPPATNARNDDRGRSPNANANVNGTAAANKDDDDESGSEEGQVADTA
ncbi:cyclin [Ascosphaera apis ARSEF 7405]|uniref:RNA polymerase II holoenzyme cyclin-like subunit n=1 Tax=Ascosphaera apis ARSEF 7405 TaxID=392613 RepID=A0A166NLV3_9EURO|nr:cyclin [Ascosphaera apis ARSEF 7405]